MAPDADACDRAAGDRREAPGAALSSRTSIGLIDALAGSGDSQLAALQAFAQERDYVNVDLSQLAEWICRLPARWSCW